MAKKVSKKTTGAPASASAAPEARPARPSRSRARGAAGAEAAPAARAGVELVPVPPASSLDALLGQPRATAVLDDALASGRVHHAWIFHGPPGVGKFTAALAFAAVLLDGAAERDLAGRVRPAQAGRVARLLAEGRHPDLHVVRKELARFSDDKQVRDRKLLTIPKDVVVEHLIRPAYLSPVLSVDEAGGPALARKVFIVDEAELLDASPTNAPVQNALLKTLEEPPAGTVIVLVTSAEDRLLPTIRSRCQRVAFGPLDDASMQAWLDSAADQLPDDVRTDAASLAWLRAYAAGSPGRLLDAATTGMAAWPRTLDPMLAASEAGRFVPGLGGAMAALCDAWAKAWVARGQNRSKDSANREAARRMLALLADRARGRLLADPASALGVLELIAQAERRLASNVALAMVMEGLAAELPVAGDHAGAVPRA